MESIWTLEELKKREDAKDKAERAARVKALTTEGLRMEAEQQKKPMPKKSGGRVKAKSYFSSY